jgi:hypothetical protein
MAGKELKIVSGHAVVRVCLRSSLVSETVHNQGSSMLGHIVKCAYYSRAFGKANCRWIGPIVRHVGIDCFGNHLHLKGNALRFQQVGNCP